MSMTKLQPKPTVPGLPIGALALRAELAGGQLKSLHNLNAGDIAIEVVQGRDNVWVLLRREGHGGLALRTAYAAGGIAATLKAKSNIGCTVTAHSALGDFTVKIALIAGEHPMLRATTSLKPAADLLIPFLPRDLYPIDNNGDPARTSGEVEAAQRGVNGGMLYFRMQRPAFGSVFYFQNLTALNDYFTATQTTPDGAVGGEWPELGLQPPTYPMSSVPPKHPLLRGKAVTISDAFVQVRDSEACDEQVCAAEFLDMLGDVYRQIDKPAPQFRDWPARADKTLRDLDRAPAATIEHYGHRYIHPYTAAEYPDSMVQISVASAIAQYGEWRGRTARLQDEFTAGLDKFYDRRLKVLRRYLPNVGKDKNRNAVDSWYLYHPLLNLARMAKAGNAKARRLFTDSLGYAVAAARHFNYAWPIQYDVRDFSIVTAARDQAGHGQTDVGGIYAYLMVQAADITGDNRYLDEAIRALKALEGLRFNLVYQANLTAWGAVACAKLFRETADPWFMRQADVFLAGLFHNSEVWESRIGHAAAHKNFLGVTCLHDAPYMAIYECFETFTAFDEFAELAGEDAAANTRMLISEYRRYTLDRAWFYYPDALPQSALAQDGIRNGYIDPGLSFPLEDLYGDGQLCGQVGQEIYGCGAAFLFASLAFQRPKGAPVNLFCDRRLGTVRVDGRAMVLHPDTPDGFSTRISLLAKGKGLPRTLTVADAAGETAAPQARHPRRIDYELPAGPITVRW